jgi:hypothetical protein
MMMMIIIIIIIIIIRNRFKSESKHTFCSTKI